LRNYWWPQMSRYIGLYVKTCDIYNWTKLQHCQPYVKLHPTETPADWWNVLQLSMWAWAHPFPRKQGLARWKWHHYKSTIIQIVLLMTWPVHSQCLHQTWSLLPDPATPAL
jgi:hypothetical protein